MVSFHVQLLLNSDSLCGSDLLSNIRFSFIVETQGEGSRKRPRICRQSCDQRCSLLFDMVPGLVKVQQRLDPDRSTDTDQQNQKSRWGVALKEHVVR